MTNKHNFMSIEKTFASLGKEAYESTTQAKKNAAEVICDNVTKNEQSDREGAELFASIAKKTHESRQEADKKAAEVLTNIRSDYEKPNMLETENSELRVNKQEIKRTSLKNKLLDFFSGK